MSHLDWTTPSSIRASGRLMLGFSLLILAHLLIPPCITAPSLPVDLQLPDKQREWVLLGKHTASPLTIGPPRLSHASSTYNCSSSVKLFHFATISGFIQDRGESAYRQEVAQLTPWCSSNSLDLNTQKTVEQIIDKWLQTSHHLHSCRAKRHKSKIIFDSYLTLSNLVPELLLSGRRWIKTSASRHTNTFLKQFYSSTDELT